MTTPMCHAYCKLNGTVDDRNSGGKRVDFECKEGNVSWGAYCLGESRHTPLKDYIIALQKYFCFHAEARKRDVTTGIARFRLRINRR